MIGDKFGIAAATVISYLSVITFHLLLIPEIQMELTDLQTKFEEIKEKVTQLGRFL